MTTQPLTEVEELEKRILAANNPEQRRLLLKQLQELTKKETRVRG